jgi:hypothetical protein
MLSMKRFVGLSSRLGAQAPRLEALLLFSIASRDKVGGRSVVP